MDDMTDTKTLADELLPCPFCGNIPDLQFYHADSRGAYGNEWRIDCKCGMVQLRWDCEAFGKDNMRERAVHIWNRRAAPEAVGEREELATDLEQCAANIGRHESDSAQALKIAAEDAVRLLRQPQAEPSDAKLHVCPDCPNIEDCRSASYCFIASKVLSAEPSDGQVRAAIDAFQNAVMLTKNWREGTAADHIAEWEGYMRAALRAAGVGGVPGMALVPREPTVEMWAAGKHETEVNAGNWQATWRRMWDAYVSAIAAQEG